MEERKEGRRRREAGRERWRITEEGRKKEEREKARQNRVKDARERRDEGGAVRKRRNRIR